MPAPETQQAGVRVNERKPFAKMESRDERVTVRLTTTEREEWAAAARQAGEELSRYFRRCARIGRNVIQSKVRRAPPCCEHCWHRAKDPRCHGIGRDYNFVTRCCRCGEVDQRTRRV